VCKLDTRQTPLVTDEGSDIGESLGVLVAPDTEVGRCDPTPGLDSGRFRHDDSRATYCATRQMLKMPVRRQTVSLFTGVLTHRRHHYAVRRSFLRQFDRREKIR